MKILKNAKDAICLSCKHYGATISDFGNVVCSTCGSALLHTKQGGVFEPKLESPTYQASVYTPPVACRRKRDVFVLEDRRKNRRVGVTI